MGNQNEDDQVHDGPPVNWADGRILDALEESETKNNWNMETDGLMAVLDEIISLYPVDDKKVYLSGLSMGGLWCMGFSHKIPRKTAALATVCSGGVAEKAHVLKNLPIWGISWCQR